MKPSASSRCRQAGNMLLMVLILAGATLTVVATALSLAANRNLISMRSNAWNNALPVAEAGIEEALTQLEYGNSATNGWHLSNGYYIKTQANPFGDSDAFYSVTITPTNPPVITSAGYVRTPLGSTYLQRTIQVTTTNSGRFPYGLLVKKTISLGGNAVADSFDSGDPTYSNAGQYSAAKRKANCKVGTLSGAIGVLQLGTTKVYGAVGTGPGLGTYTIGNSGCVGDIAYVNNGLNVGTIQVGHLLTNLNLTIPDVPMPYAFGKAVNSGSFLIGGTNYNYCLGKTNYYISGDFKLSNSDAMIVTNVATLYITGSFTINGSAMIYIPPGGKLTIYVGTTNVSTTCSISIGGGGVLNASGYAANFAVNGLPSVTSAAYNGGAEFVGTFYSPEADVNLSGGTDAAGAIVAQSVKITGGMNFHYDEALAGGLGLLRYLISSWREL